MPIYAYRCANCGFAQDVLQKMSDPKLTVCPNCGQSTFEKQVTAAGFQLKGSGWYATDFKNSGAAPAPKPAADAPAPTAPASDAAAASGSKDSPVAPSAAAPAPAPAVSKPTPSSGEKG